MFSTSKRFSVQGTNLVTTNRSQTIRQSAVKARSAELADSLPLLADGGPIGNSIRMTAAGPLAFNFMLTGIVPEHEEMLRRYYRDIYLYDATAGSCIDIMSAFPFSNFNLTGGKKEELDKFEESLFRLNTRALLPEISTAYLVDGVFVGSLVFNNRDKVFSDVLVHDPDTCKIEQIPFYSTDPKVVVISDEHTRRFVSSNDAYYQNIKKGFTPQFLQALASAAYELNPLTTLYLARRTLPSKPIHSFLKRILPIYLLEKQLYRGTLVEAHKRQRALLHIQAGDDNWEPTPEELEALVAMFQQAELDPLGAVLATHTSVNIAEARQGGDFWKWTDIADTLVPYKLRALGISEAFLSGDANYSNAEIGQSVFMESMDTYRDFVTHKVFYNKLFPIISYTNGFFKDKSHPQTGTTLKQMQYSINNQRDLLIPKVSWHKPLESKREQDPMDALEKLSDKGMPIPLRMWAAAARVDVDNLLHELAEDKELRQNLEKFTGQESTDYDKDEGAGGEGDDEGQYASMISLLSQKRRKKPLLSRDFGETGEVKGKTKTGKDKYIFSQREAQHAVNVSIAKAQSKLNNDPQYRESIKKKVIAKFGRMPDLSGVGHGR